MNRSVNSEADRDNTNGSDSGLETPKQSRRPGFQFSLRFLIVFTAVVGCAGVLASSMYRARFERSVANRAQGAGGRVLFDYQHENGAYIADREPPGPKWLRDLFGQNIFARATFAEFHVLPIKEVKSVIGGLKRIESLTLFNCNIKEIDFADSFPRLKFLKLCSCNDLSDISALSQAKQLEHLDLYQCTSLTDISVIAQLKNLRHLDLSETAATNFEPLNSLTKLESLRLMDCQLVDTNDFHQLLNLHELHLTENELLNDVSALRELPQLHTVDLRSCPLLSFEQIQSLKHALPNTTIISN